MAFLEKLESVGVPVQAAATASAPLDLFVAMNGFLDFPRPNDAVWLNSIFILSAFSYENYYGVPGLARSLFADDYYEIAKKAYDRQPFDPAAIPADLRKLIRADYFDPQLFRQFGLRPPDSGDAGLSLGDKIAGPQLLRRGGRGDHSGRRPHGDDL